MSSPAPQRRNNRLAAATSPYLLQHAQNPVDWYPWGDEAFEKAAREDKPVFLSIGYAACHWCHVMERESFENEALARILNEHFVAIKVDREERPDIDSIYMSATVAMSGSGGWPMSVFLTPDQKPFFAGTYFPPDTRYGRPGFGTLLERISKLWKENRGELLQQATELTNAIAAEAQADAPRSIEADVEVAAVKQLARTFDAQWGGFGRAPKFPAPGSLSLLLRHHANTGDESALAMARKTLDKMAEGGMADHLGGGFARYSTDEKWLVPHFEKMLYDNAQLARVYLEALQITAHDEYRRVAVETLDYVLREMVGAEGGYFSATDADSEGEEGKFFVWSLREIEDLLDPASAKTFAAYYDVTELGNWEGKNVLWTPRPLAEVARELGMSAQEVRASVAKSKSALLEVRSKRIPPLLDDKILVAWNALMIGAMAFGHRVLGDARYLASAEAAASFVLERMARPDGGLFRTFRAGKAHVPGFLEDYAFFVDALVDLFEETGDTRWMSEAVRLAERLIADFGDDEPEGGAFYATARDHEKLVVRMREGVDGAIPSANAVAARALVRLSEHLGRDDFRIRAEAALRAHGRAIGRQPRAFTTSLDVLHRLLRPAVEVALVGGAADPALVALGRELGRTYVSNLVVARLDPARGPTSFSHPLLDGKTLVAGRAAAYVCRNFTCAAPVTEPEGLRTALAEARDASGSARAPVMALPRIAGVATAAATHERAAKHAPETLRAKLGDLTVGRVGVLVESFREEAAQTTVARAFDLGVNLLAFDAQRASAVGDALATFSAAGRVARESLVLIGLLTGESNDIADVRQLVEGARLERLDAVLVASTGSAERIGAALDLAARAVAEGLATRGGVALDFPLEGHFGDMLVMVLGERADKTAAIVAATSNLLEGDADVLRRLAEAGHPLVTFRPLDARDDGRSIRLEDPSGLPTIEHDGVSFAMLRDELASLEDEYRRTIAIHLQPPEGSGLDPAELLSWSKELTRALDALDDIEEVEAFLARFVGPTLRAQLEALSELPGPVGQQFAALRGRYVETLNGALKALAREVVTRQASLVEAVARAVTPDAPSKLPAIALGAVLAQPGVVAALLTSRTVKDLAPVERAQEIPLDAGDGARAVVAARSRNDR